MKETKYTIGIYFDSKLKKVALILKNRPEWQRGLYNFPGGHIEENETPEECISREFKEECLVKTDPKEWMQIGAIHGNNYTVIMLLCIQKEEHSELRTGEDQPVFWKWIHGIPDNCIKNVHWITYYALNIVNDLSNGNNGECLNRNNVFNYSERP
jgi:ADP-ribose pyrophosphatase YjhB (NUDIX family)